MAAAESVGGPVSDQEVSEPVEGSTSGEGEGSVSVWPCSCFGACSCSSFKPGGPLKVEESVSAVVVEGSGSREVDNRVMPSEIPESEVEVNYRVKLKYNTTEYAEKEQQKRLVALEAFNWWTESVAVLEGKLSRRTKRKDGLKNEIYQLVGLYSVFVGVVFSAVQSDRVQCRHIWSPFVLSLLTSFIIVYAVNRKFLEVARIRDDYIRDDSARKNLLSYLANLNTHGYVNFDFKKHAKNNVTSELRKKWDDAQLDHAEINPRPVVIFILTISTAVLVASFVHILCFTPSPSCEGCVTWPDYALGLRSPYRLC